MEKKLEKFKCTEKDLAKKVEEVMRERKERAALWKDNTKKLEYSEKDLDDYVALETKKLREEQELFKQNVSKTANEISRMMGLKLDNIDFSVSDVNKDRQTDVLFKEIQKANAERLEREKLLQSSHSLRKERDDHVINEEMSDINQDICEKDLKGEVPVSKEEKKLYIKVNEACSSRLPPEKSW
ncbi:hypothetical protein C1646_723552 [Rhizophagus diaphanus]|nr:hypothetical protein C1646_723552 [Rhizophagus diaphanus] [Rhizophagus sp. MUCL 43196]